jgi:hypothetical protein
MLYMFTFGGAPRASYFRHMSSGFVRASLMMHPLRVQSQLEESENYLAAEVHKPGHHRKIKPTAVAKA